MEREHSGTVMPSLLFAALERGVKIYDLAHPMFNGMPQSADHPAFYMNVARRHGDLMRADGSSGANEIIITGGHVGTHIDALCHISYEGKLHDGSLAVDVTSNAGFTRMGAETIQPIVARGVLLDIPAAKGEAICDEGYEVTAEDLEAASRLGKTVPAPGDVILVRTGWGGIAGERARYEGRGRGTPGPAAQGAEWLAQFHPRAVGSDTLAFERLPPGNQYPLPAHRILIVKYGIHIIEALNLDELASDHQYEFMFILCPLKLVGATGSPVRPLALVDAEGGV